MESGCGSVTVWLMAIEGSVAPRVASVCASVSRGDARGCARASSRGEHGGERGREGEAGVERRIAEAGSPHSLAKGSDDGDVRADSGGTPRCSAPARPPSPCCCGCFWRGRASSSMRDEMGPLMTFPLRGTWKLSDCSSLTKRRAASSSCCLRSCVEDVVGAVVGIYGGFSFFQARKWSADDRARRPRGSAA